MSFIIRSVLLLFLVSCGLSENENNRSDDVSKSNNEFSTLEEAQGYYETAEPDYAPYWISENEICATHPDGPTCTDLRSLNSEATEYSLIYRMGGWPTNNGTKLTGLNL